MNNRKYKSAVTGSLLDHPIFLVSDGVWSCGADYFATHSEHITLETFEADAYGPQITISIHESAHNGYDRELFTGF